MHLNEPSILNNTRLRFAKDQIYTFTGRILVAVNPFKLINGLYGEAATERFAKQACPNLSHPEATLQPLAVTLYPAPTEHPRP